jgi:tetratricopeptide (TPR) repeat protein
MDGRISIWCGSAASGERQETGYQPEAPARGNSIPRWRFGFVSCFLPLLLALSLPGCITPQTQQQNTVPSSKADDQAAAKKDEGPKRNPQPRTELAFGQMKEAEAETENAKQNPDLQARWRDEARKAYQKAIDVDPNFVDAYRCLGRLYSKMGDWDRAFDNYNKALAKHPRDPVIFYEIGMCHNRRKNFDEAIRCFQKALEYDPEYRDALKTLGFTLAYSGQTEKGLAYLTRAYQGSAMAHFYLARVMLEKDRPDQARQLLRQALMENPQYEQARELLTRLENPITTASAQLGSPVQH